MTTEVIMPSLGESVEEATITRWLKSPGETVEEYEPLLEVNTDKVDSEIPSPASGKLVEIKIQEGTIVQAGTVLALIAAGGEEASPTSDHPEKVEPDQEVDLAPVPEAVSGEGSQQPHMQFIPGKDNQLGFISPVVARMAGEHNLDLSLIEGTGQGGRITKKDVQNYLEKREKAPQAAPSVSQGTATHPVAEYQVRETPPAALQPAGLPPSNGEVIPHSTVRRAIAEHMVMSKRTSPHVTTVMEVDLSRVVEHRQANKSAFARDGVNLTFTAYFVAATVAALKAYPIVNSSWSDEGIRLHPQVNIGMATSLEEEGLIVPVIKNADSLSLLGLARTINDLAGRARSRKLQPDEVKGGTFTITNHGTSGSLFASPIINQPQCGILGVGAIQKRVVVVENDAIAVRPMVYLSFTFDHRILDGAIADSFLSKVVESLKRWDQPLGGR